MNFIGIDVSSKKLNIHISGNTGGDYEISNCKKSLKAFVKKHNICPKDYVIGAESTGKYHLITQSFFVLNGFEFRLVNPICTKKMIVATVRKKKTDASDAALIAFLIANGGGDIVDADQLNTAKRDLLRTRDTLNKHRKSIQLLEKQLSNDLDKNAIIIAIKALKKVIKVMEDSVRKIEQEALMNDQTSEEKLIQSIPGFAKLLSATVASEVGKFSRFSSARKFKAYVGIDPKIIQSGESQRYGKITKRGKPNLRSAFYLAAQVARQYDPELKSFYEKKREEGKPFRVAICAVSRKLCERVYAVIKRGTPYQIS